MAQLNDLLVTGSSRFLNDINANEVKTNILQGTIYGTGTAAQDKGSGVSPRYFPAKWTFNTGHTPVDGDIINITLPVAGHSWGDWVSIDNGVSYHPANTGGTGRLSTNYGVGTTIQLVFDADGQTNSMTPVNGADSVNGSNITGGCWRVVNYYDTNSNNYDRNLYNASIKCGTTAIVAGNIIVGKDGVFHHLKDGTAFDITYPILYANGAIAANATSTNNYDVLAINLQTTQTITLTAYKPVFIKGTISGNIFTPVNTTPLTQTVPTTADNYHYILLGVAYSATNIYLDVDHRIFAYKNGKFGEIVNDALSVNGYTVAKSVPSNAVFTDTDTKVTSSANHYTPATASGQDKTASASGATAAWSIDVVKGVTLNTDGKGHVTGLSVTSGKIPANPNTDTKVTQTNSTTASDYRLLLSGSANDTTETTTAIKSTNFKANPSTGLLTVKAEKSTVNKSMLTGTGTAAQDKGSGVSPRYFPAKWTFNTGITVADGDMFTIKLPVAGHSYGEFISVNNGTNYYPVGYNTNTALTTHFPVGAIITVVFKSDGVVNSIYPVAGGDAKVNVSGGAFYVLDLYDSGNSNTYDRNRFNAAIKVWGTALVAQNIIVANTSGLYMHLKQNAAFDITYPMLYLAEAVAANGTTTNTYDIINFATATTQSGTWTAYKPVYIKGQLSGTTFTPVSATPLTQTIPTTADGYEYMLLGYATATTTVYLQERHPICAYRNGKFGEVVNDADSVNGYTVAKSVPSDALFTDTNTKVTAVGNHYIPTSSGTYTASASGATAAWSIDVVKGVTLQKDAAGHITGISVTSGKIPANPNTDANVTQTATTTDAEYEVLFSATADNTTRTEGARKTSTLRFNPSKGALMEGSSTTASGNYAHAEGQSTAASGSNSHAEGYSTSASGARSHAEGRLTTASGDSSHAEGYSTYASVSYAHAEGYSTSAFGIRSHAEGSQTAATSTAAHAEGQSTAASGNSSHAEGRLTTASGNYSHAEGNSTSASGIDSHAEGNGSTASGNYSHAEGEDCLASNTWSHAEGEGTTASGSHSHSEGAVNLASGNCAHTEGAWSTASGARSHAEGYYTCAVGEGSHTEGERTTASGKYSHAEGEYSRANTDYSHVEGERTYTFAKQSHAEGYGARTSGEYSHAEGYYTCAVGNGSHAEGYNTAASGNSSHAEGDGSSRAFGDGSHAEGYKTSASGNYSHAGGYCTTASNFASRSFGHYNAAMTTGGSASNTTGTALVIGNGTATTALKNAFSVQYNGVVKAASTITASTTADYAEYFEWADENPNDEDRVGYFVTFDDGDKIRFATSEDNYILGVTSGEPFVLGNGDCDVWNGMILRDEFRRVIYEPAPDYIQIEGGGKIPHLDKNGNQVYNGTRPKLNPNYDPTKPYVNRADRPEWCPVGMLGVLAVRDDGTCEVNGYATVRDDATATKYTEQSQNKYRVIRRNTQNVVEIVFR